MLTDKNIPGTVYKVIDPQDSKKVIHVHTKMKNDLTVVSTLYYIVQSDRLMNFFIYSQDRGNVLEKAS